MVSNYFCQFKVISKKIASISLSMEGNQQIWFYWVSENPFKRLMVTTIETIGQPSVA